MKVPISRIKENPDNPRYIRDEKFEKLVKSIQEFPEMLTMRPIVVDENMVALGGNMRLKACKEVGLKEVEVLVANGWTEEQKKEFIIKDNIGFGEWDYDALANGWNEGLLDDWGLNIPDFDLETEEENEPKGKSDDEKEKCPECGK